MPASAFDLDRLLDLHVAIGCIGEGDAAMPELTNPTSRGNLDA